MEFFLSSVNLHKLSILECLLMLWPIVVKSFHLALVTKSKYLFLWDNLSHVCLNIFSFCFRICCSKDVAKKLHTYYFCHICIYSAWSLSLPSVFQSVKRLLYDNRLEVVIKKCYFCRLWCSIIRKWERNNACMWQ